MSLVTLLVGLFQYGVGQAQDCMGLPMKTGASYEMSMYDGKDKPTGTMLYTVKNVRKEGSSTIVDVETQMTSAKGKAMPSGLLHYTCTGNEVVVDMSGFGGGNPAMKDMEVKMVNNDIAYPRTLKSGSTLKDGTLKTEAYNNGTKMMEMTMSMTNRQVGDKETVTTSAGTFDTHKVSSDLNMESKMMGIPIRRVMRTVSYRNDDLLFDVKNESYDKNGKLIGYTVLSKVP